MLATGARGLIPGTIYVATHMEQELCRMHEIIPRMNSFSYSSFCMRYAYLRPLSTLNARYTF